MEALGRPSWSGRGRRGRRQRSWLVCVLGPLPSVLLPRWQWAGCRPGRCSRGSLCTMRRAGVGVGRPGSLPLSGLGSRWSRRGRKPHVLLPAPSFLTGLRPALLSVWDLPLLCHLPLTFYTRGAGSIPGEEKDPQGWPASEGLLQRSCPPTRGRPPTAQGERGCPSPFPDTGTERPGFSSGL